MREQTAWNKAIARRLVEDVIGQRRFDLLPDLIAPTYVAHLPIGDHFGIEGLTIAITSIWKVFPDLSIQLDGLLAEGDCVARRYTLRGTQTAPDHDHAVTGSTRPTIFHSIAIDRFLDGRIVETWVGTGVMPLSVAQARGP